MPIAVASASYAELPRRATGHSVETVALRQDNGGRPTQRYPFNPNGSPWPDHRDMFHHPHAARETGVPDGAELVAPDSWRRRARMRMFRTPAMVG